MKNSHANRFALLVFVVAMMLIFSVVSTASAAELHTTASENALWQTSTVDLFADQSHPVSLVASYYNAINLFDYARAYSYWNGGEPRNQTLRQFTQGFADTASVEGWAVLPQSYQGAAGSIYAEVPVLLRATQFDGDQQLFAGCFVTRKSNVPVGNNTQPDPNWFLSNGTLEAVNTLSISAATADCADFQTFPLTNAYNDALSPIDLLTSYYDAIARADYTRAYSYWNGQPRNQTLQQFTQGFAGTSNIQVVVRLVFVSEGAAGSSYASIPAVVTAVNNGRNQFFAGCFLAYRSSVPVGNPPTPPDPNWRFYRGDITAVNGLEAGLNAIVEGCA